MAKTLIMGLFTRRRGGTKVGNFIRQWLWNNSEITEGVHAAGMDVASMTTEQRMELINGNLK